MHGQAMSLLLRSPNPCFSLLGVCIAHKELLPQILRFYTELHHRMQNWDLKGNRIVSSKFRTEL